MLMVIIMIDNARKRKNLIIWFDKHCDYLLKKTDMSIQIMIE